MKKYVKYLKEKETIFMDYSSDLTGKRFKKKRRSSLKLFRNNDYHFFFKLNNPPFN